MKFPAILWRKVSSAPVAALLKEQGKQCPRSPRVPESNWKVAYENFANVVRIYISILQIKIIIITFRTTQARNQGGGRRGAKRPRKLFVPLEKCFGHHLKILDIVQKIWSPLGKLFAPPGVPSWLRAWNHIKSISTWSSSNHQRSNDFLNIRQEQHTLQVYRCAKSMHSCMYSSPGLMNQCRVFLLV